MFFVKFMVELFYVFDLFIFEGYGLIEMIGVLIFNIVDVYCFGMVGCLFFGVEVKLVEDGEILIWGCSVIVGYWCSVDFVVFIDDGYFRTGDVGVFDTDGYLMVTDCKKDIIVIVGGKNVVFVRVEFCLMRSFYIDCVVVVGDCCKYFVVLFEVDCEVIFCWVDQYGFGGDCFVFFCYLCVWVFFLIEVECVNEKFVSFE